MNNPEKLNIEPDEGWVPDPYEPDLGVNTEGDRRNWWICSWCDTCEELCVNVCQPENKFRQLKPSVLEWYEFGALLPEFGEFLDMKPPAQLALLYLMAYYGDCKNYPPTEDE